MPNSVTVYFTITGSATEDADYEDIGASVVLPPNTPTVQIPIEAVMETEFEPNESVILTLQPDSAYTIGTNDSATLWIQHCNGYMQGPRVIPRSCPQCGRSPFDAVNGGSNPALTIDIPTVGLDTEVWKQTPPFQSGIASSFAAPAFSSNPVRYADGVVSVVSHDLESDGMGVPWGITRSWTNAQAQYRENLW